MRRIAITVIAIAVVAAACTGSESTTTTVPGTTQPPVTLGSLTTGPGAVAITERFDPRSVQFVAALERFDRCETFLEHIKAEALARVGPYGLDGGPRFGPVFFDEDFAPGMAAGEDRDSAPQPASTSAVAQDGVDFSGTNVQVAGVDEPDVVKTDGTRILAITDQELHYIDVSGDDPERTDSVFLGNGWNHRLFIAGDRAFVFSDTGWGHFEPALRAVAESILPAEGSMVSITEVDLSDPDDLRVGRTLTIQGSFVAARSVDGTARIVTSSYPAGLAFVYPSGPAAESIAMQANRAVIEQSTLETWLPAYVLSAGDEVIDQGVLADCDAIHRPGEFSGFEMLSVLTLDLNASLEPGDVTTVTARGETVYASTESLYVATNVWVPEDASTHPDAARFDDRYSTALHKFDISGEGPARYVASGSVEGHVLNQFALNEYDGRLQVATTQGAPWGFREDAESFVTVLNQDGDSLVEVGKVGDLGRGERIFAVRFMGDVGYVVTFRQVDPLYVIDLSDPSDPEVTGELKIPGYSAYLHPIGDGKLLGVGQDATEEGFTTGAKVSLFDVSDPSDPREMDAWTLADGYTEAEWNHLAFLYWPPEQTAVLPVQSWSIDFFGAVVLKTDDGLREAGRISHREREIEIGASDCRAITADDLGIPRNELPSDVLIQVCEGDEPGGAAGYYCETFPEEEMKFLAEEFVGETGVDLEEFIGDDERLELCWREYYEQDDPIMRSLVIGDDLWTLSRRTLQANSLETLDVLYQIALDG